MFSCQHFEAGFCASCAQEKERDLNNKLDAINNAVNFDSQPKSKTDRTVIVSQAWYERVRKLAQSPWSAGPICIWWKKE